MNLHPSRRARLAPMLAIAFLAGCTDRGDDAGPAIPAADRPTVFVVNYPLRFFAERIGGAHVDVVFPAPRDADPAFWQPDAATIVTCQSADAILLNGAGYAKWVPMVSLPEARVVDTSTGFRDALLPVQAGIQHTHGPTGAHDHGGTAFTTWLDLRQAIDQATAVRDALSRLLPDRAAVCAANFRALERDLLALDARMGAIAETIGDRPLVASHPVYQYWARRYDLEVASVLWEPEVVPDDDALAALRRRLADHPAKWMIWEGVPAPQSMAKLAALDIGSVVFEPCANAPDEGDFLDAMRANLTNLERAFAP